MVGYFGCSWASGEGKENALIMVEFIEGLGHKILDRHVVAKNEQGHHEEFCKNSGIPLGKINFISVRKQDLQWVNESEFAVFDITFGSWGGGIEFHQATVVRKLLGLEPIPILCLRHKEAKPSWLVLGIDQKEFPNVFFGEYDSIQEAIIIIDSFFLLIPRLYE